MAGDFWRLLSPWRRAAQDRAPLRPRRTRPTGLQTLEPRLCLGSAAIGDADVWAVDDAATSDAIAAETLVVAGDADAVLISVANDATGSATPVILSDEAHETEAAPIVVTDGSDSTPPIQPPSDEPLIVTALPSPLDEPRAVAANSTNSQTVVTPGAPPPSTAAADDDHSAPTMTALESGVGVAALGGTATVTFEPPDAATGAVGQVSIAVPSTQALVATPTDPLVIAYDFRAVGEFDNRITAAQQHAAVAALDAWSEALGGAVVFQRNDTLPVEQILNIGVGDLAAFGYTSAPGGTLGMGGGTLQPTADAEPALQGVIWLDAAESWETSEVLETSEVSRGAVDLATVVAHEVGHTLGLPDAPTGAPGIMQPAYDPSQPLTPLVDSIRTSLAVYNETQVSIGDTTLDADPMVMASPQLTGSEVETLLERAAVATVSEDAIIAVVDRNGRILGIRAEQDVLDTITDEDTLVFAIDGAVSKARTAAFFSSGDPTNTDEHSPLGTVGPLTTRTVRFISQSTVTQREVESNPNVPDFDSPERGPGFVAPIGLGGHFPPEIAHTPPVDLFAIEHTNRDSLTNPGADQILGTSDDFELRSRFNIDPATYAAGAQLFAPESYGVVSGFLPSAQSRGIATLPGGIPLYRDTNGDGVGETLVGGIGVFFPGPDGYATFEQGFVPGVGQTETERTNSEKSLEAEFIAFAAAGGSTLADNMVEGAKVGDLGGVAPVPGLDLPFGRIDLVGINLQIVGPTAGPEGVQQLLELEPQFGVGQGADSGANQSINPGGDMLPGTSDDSFVDDGLPVSEGWIVTPHDSPTGELTAAQVEQIITDAIAGAEQTRAAIRLDGGTLRPGSRTRMVLAVTDSTGEVLGLYRMKDATVFSIDVAVAKARNVSYYADATALQPEDQVPSVDPGVAFSNRTFRFLAEPRFPAGVDGSLPPVFSILNDPGINPLTAENLGAPRPASDYVTVLGYDAFHPMTNFRDPGDSSVEIDGGIMQPTANQNGVIFFPGSTPVYVDGDLRGGFGVSGDGVDQDDVVTFLGATDFLPDGESVIRSDQVEFDTVNLPFIKFLRNPFG